jgi:RNA polymerase sigma factor (sigma-70 family)
LKWQYLPKHVASLFRSHPCFQRYPFDDLVQEGFVALIRSAERWEESRGVKFISYAHRAIANSLRRILFDAGLIHVPAHLDSKSSKETSQHCRAAAERAWAIQGIAPENDPPAREGWLPEDSEEVLALLRRLPPLVEKVLRLRFWEGLSMGAIGKRIFPHVTKQCIQIHVNRGLRLMREMVGSS